MSSVYHHHNNSSSSNSSNNVRNDWLIKEITKNYRIMGVIGEGGYGRVYVGYEKDSDLPVAIKLSPATKNTTNELKLLKRLRHPRLCNVYRTDILRNHLLSQSNFSLIIMEKMDIDLADYLLNREPLSPSELKIVFRSICQGVLYLHSKRVAHLDIKLDNILLKLNDDYGVEDVKICDFGFARRWKRSKAGRSKVTEFIGTTNYRAPELNAKNELAASFSPKKSKSKTIGGSTKKQSQIIETAKKMKGKIGSGVVPEDALSPRDEELDLQKGCEVALDKVDIFALGVVLYAMLTLDFPEGKAVDELNLVANNMHNILDCTEDPQLVDILQKMLEYQPQVRLNIQEVLEHPWLQ